MPDTKREHDRERIRDRQIEKRLETQKYRQKMIEIPVQAATLTSVNAFGSKRSETKTTKRVSKALLKSSNKKRAVFQKLTVVLFPNQTAF